MLPLIPPGLTNGNSMPSPLVPDKQGREAGRREEGVAVLVAGLEGLGV